jgi:hypothetical protein
MAHVITFRSARFDVAAEPPNPRGASQLADDDPLSALVERLVRQEAAAIGVEVERRG